MGRGKRTGIALASGGRRLPHISPFQVSALSKAIVAERFINVDADLERGNLWSFLRTLRDLPPSAIHSSALDDYWTKATTALLTDMDGEVIEGAARRYLTGLRLVESMTPYIVWSRGQQRMLHLRAEENGARTLCGVPILSGWVKQAERGAYTSALEDRPLSRDQQACRRCQKRSAESLGSETPRYEVLSEKMRQEMQAAGLVALKNFVIQGDWWSETMVTNDDHAKAASAARDGAMAVLRLETGAQGFARGPEWLLDNWFDGYHLEKPLREVYGDAIPSPDAAFLAQGLQMPGEGTIMWQGQALSHAALAHLLPRVSLSYWPDAIERILGSFDHYRTRPFTVTRIKKAAEEVGLVERGQL